MINNFKFPKLRLEIFDWVLVAVGILAIIGFITVIGWVVDFFKWIF